MFADIVVCTRGKVPSVGRNRVTVSFQAVVQSGDGQGPRAHDEQNARQEPAQDAVADLPMPHSMNRGQGLSFIKGVGAETATATASGNFINFAINRPLFGFQARRRQRRLKNRGMVVAVVARKSCLFTSHNSNLTNY